MSVNPDSIQPGQPVHSRRPPPPTESDGKGHAPGVLVGNDAVPTSHIETLPAGTAPREHTYPSNAHESTIPGQADNPAMDPESRTSAADTLVGSTSAEIHNRDEFGKPASGMTSQESHGGHRKKERSGVVGVAVAVGDAVQE